jgi:hypothetical protein
MFDLVNQPQVGVSNNTVANSRFAIVATGAHGSYAVCELCLAYGPQCLQAILAVHGKTLYVDCSFDTVTRIYVGEKLVEQIAPRGAIPQVVMRIDYRQFWLQHLLAKQGKPVGSHT